MKDISKKSINVLINAYAISPNWGSEPGMGWNWVIHLAKYCNLYIITEGEWRKDIEAAVQLLPQGKNMHFYYNNVPDKVRKMCWNQGDWRFYWYYQKWQRKTLSIAKQVVKEHKIDLLHQLNMIGFREPGYLWQIKKIPFVWGPIGGMELMPMSFLKEADFKQRLFAKIKNIINDYQRKHDRRVVKALNKSSILIAATKGAYELIDTYHRQSVVLINETGCKISEQFASPTKKPNTEIFELLWVGKFDFRKQLNIAIRTMANLKHLPVCLNIVGTGSASQVEYYKKLAQSLDVTDMIVWHGVVDNPTVQELMKKKQLFFFTSIMEATSTVVLEAISNNLPVLCFNTCGFGAIVNNEIGATIEISTERCAIDDFSQKIEYLYNSPDLLNNMSQNCVTAQQELSWDSKAKRVLKLYNTIIDK